MKMCKLCQEPIKSFLRNCNCFAVVRCTCIFSVFDMCYSNSEMVEYLIAKFANPACIVIGMFLCKMCCCKTGAANERLSLYVPVCVHLLVTAVISVFMCCC